MDPSHAQPQPITGKRIQHLLQMDKTLKLPPSSAPSDDKLKKKKKRKSVSMDDVPAPPVRRGRNYTCSMAVAGSTVSGGPDLVACIAGQIARAAVAGEIDEVVVYEDSKGGSSGGGGIALARALQFLETPPYLRAALCPTDASSLARLQPFADCLQAPHHVNQTDWLPYREGVVLKSSGKGDGEEHGHSFVDVGLDRMAYVPAHLPVRARCTVSLGEASTSKFVPEYSETMIIGEVRGRRHRGWPGGEQV